MPMPSRRRMFGRDPGEDGGEEKRLTPERAARERGRVGRFAAWLGFGPEEEGVKGEDTEERIRAAAARATEQAEQRATQEILALEEDFERARQEAAGAVADLESRLAQMEG